MFLKRIELQGFKSFSDKIRLDFKKGITAVVGPNGSGKSNISDALRWVLGEQSAKSLRGTKMEDVIFSGTQSRKPLGFAEVSMTVDNSDGTLPIDYNEVTILRRVYRSGESEFRINGTACRLKDVHELFMDTGIGKEGYSIIGQGRIDEILSTKSEDRRLLFEEATGIVKYKNRRMQAQSKLEKERQNLIRVTDIINELQSQIEPLKEAAEKTKSFLSLSEQLKLIQVNIFVQNVDRTEADKGIVSENLLNITSELQDEENNLKAYETEQKDVKEQITKMEEYITAINSELTEIRSEMEQKENDIKLTASQIDYIKNDIERNNNSIDKINTLSLDSDLKVLFIRKQAAELKLFTEREVLAEKETELFGVNSRLAENEQSIERINAEIIRLIKVTTDVKSSIGRNATVLEQMESSREQTRIDLELYSNAINDKAVYLKVLEKKEQAINEKEAGLKLDIDEFGNEREQLIKSISDLKLDRDALKKKEMDYKSRHKILSELERDYEGYYESVKAILRQKDTFKGIRGAVGEIITVSEIYETAIETALGSSVQHIVTETEADASAAISYLKNTKKGRATFLPIAVIKGKQLNERGVLKEKGVIGTAKELITYDGVYENVMCSILGRVIVVDNLSNAIALAGKYNHTYKIVTLEGELLNPGGALTGGFFARKQASIFSRGREIKKIDDEMKILTASIKSVLTDIEEKEERSVALKETMKGLQETLQQLALEKVGISTGIIQTKINIEELTEKGRTSSLALEELDRKIASSKDTLESDSRRLSGMTEEIQLLQTSLSEYQTGILSDRDTKDIKSKEITDIKVNIAELEQGLSAVLENIERIEKEISNHEKEISTLKQNVIDLTTEKEMKLCEIKELEAHIEVLKIKQMEKQAEHAVINQKKYELAEGLSRLEKQLRTLIEHISELKNEQTRLEIKRVQLDETSARLYNDMWEQYEITIMGARKCDKLEFSFSKLQSEEKRLKNEVKQLGSINVNAVEEFKNVSERYEFLTTQRDDIISAEDNLKDIIKRLTQMMEEQFAASFKEISKNFGAVFAEMFGGGTAHLGLSDENNILESGIDINAQPPGKKLQSMSLLSGGERALTATALLFAILRMKPSPFCVLDEVEAALDDSNVKRYANYLKKFSKDTQFILITHRKGTMEAADVLYGVTMQELGISKLVSVKLTDDEAV